LLYLLDTDVLSDLRKQRKNAALQSWLQRVAWSELSTTVITIAEIQCGIERQRPLHPAYAQETQTWLNRLLEAGRAAILPLGVKAALLLARMHETPALRHFLVQDPRQKRTRTPADLVIAAMATAAGAVLTTGNVTHFQQIHALFPLPGLYNPFADAWAIEPAPPASFGTGRNPM